MTTRSLIIAAAVALVFGLAMYLGQVWPLRALVWAGMLWGGIAALRSSL